MTKQYTDLELMQWRSAKNIGDVDIGPREIVEIRVGDDLDRSQLAVARPTDPMGASFAVNGPTTIKKDGFGKVCCGPVVLAVYAEDEGDPVLDSLWTPCADSGALRKKITGIFRCLRVVDEDNFLMLALMVSAELIPFQLEETLVSLGEARARIFYSPTDCPTITDVVHIIVRDTIDVLSPQIDPDISSGVQPRSRAEAGTCGWARRTDEQLEDEEDLQHYDIVSLGGFCCLTPESSSSGSSPSSSSPSSSSESSSSESSSSSPSSPPSTSKSSAIVPASWSPTGYTALFITEMPEVRFDDVVIATVPQVDGSLKIDPRFIEVCSPGTIEVCGCIVDLPVLVGAAVCGSSVQIKFTKQDKRRKVRLVVRLTGIRKGFVDLRFPDRTQEQFEANERFIKSSFPAESR